MPNDNQQNTEPTEEGYGSAGALALTAASIIAVAYGAYKIIGRFLNTNASTSLFDTTHLAHWQNLNETRALVHVVQSRYRNSSPLFKYPAETIFNTWDIISTSLIDSRLITTAPANSTKRRYTGLGAAVGFILDVPPQNILGTHPRDVSFPNHSPHLANDFLAGRSKNDENPLGHPHYNLLMTPDMLLSKSNKGILNTSEYNEVLIAGRPHINIYAGYPATVRPTIRGIILIPDAANGMPSVDEKNLASALVEINPGLPQYIVRQRKLFKI